MSEQIVDLIEALPQPGPRGLQGEHCHTRDVNTGAIAGRVEYRDLTYTDGTPDKTKLTPITIKEVG